MHHKVLTREVEASIGAPVLSKAFVHAQTVEWMKFKTSGKAVFRREIDQKIVWIISEPHLNKGCFRMEVLKMRCHHVRFWGEPGIDLFESSVRVSMKVGADLLTHNAFSLSWNLSKLVLINIGYLQVSTNLIKVQISRTSPLWTVQFLARKISSLPISPSP